MILKNPEFLPQSSGLKPGEFYHRVVIDMRTGHEVSHARKTFRYRGPQAHAMPNVRLKSVPTNDQLNNVITPIAPGQPEGIAWTWFDSVTYTSGTTTQADFFQTVQTDGTLGNMQAAGQLPNPMYFQLYHLGVYFNVVPQAIAFAAASTINPALGAINDLKGLMNGSIQLSIADKTYYQAKIGMCPPGYGPVPSQAAVGTFSATNGLYVDYGTAGIPDIRNRNCFWGTIIIPPTQRFLIRMNWTAALTLSSASLAIVAALDGYLFRRVL